MVPGNQFELVDGQQCDFCEEPAVLVSAEGIALCWTHRIFQGELQKTRQEIAASRAAKRRRAAAARILSIAAPPPEIVKSRHRPLGRRKGTYSVSDEEFWSRMMAAVRRLAVEDAEKVPTRGQVHSDVGMPKSTFYSQIDRCLKNRGLGWPQTSEELATFLEMN